MTIRAIDLLHGQPWAIQPETLETLTAIALRENDTPSAVAARLGCPLENTRTVTHRDGAAIIPVTGPIFRRANLFTEVSGATSVEVLATDIQAAIDDPAVSRLVLEIDSPGGQAAGIGDLAAQIRQSPKPVIAHVDNLAASAAYWIASAAQEIVVSPGAMLGSIGVVATYRPEKDAPIKVISSQSPLKQAAPDTEHGRADTQRIVDQLAALFIADVAAYRGTDPATVESKFGQGSLLIAAEAIGAGMADRIGTFESLFTAAARGTSRGSLMATDNPGAPAATIDRAYLTVNHPDLIAQIQTEARADGAAAERERIQSVRAQHIPGHEALIEQLAFDGKTTGPEAAVAVLAAEKALRQHHLAAQSAAPGPVDATLPPADKGTPAAKAVSILSDYRKATGA